MQIKVKETRMHKLAQNIPQVYSTTKPLEVSVAEGKLVLVESDNYSVLARQISTGKLFYNPKFTCKSSLAQPIKPIIISETEKIEIGDKYLEHTQHSPDRYEIYTCEEGDSIENSFKILALPEHISPKHLQDIVDGKIKDGQTVLIECEEVN